MVKDGNAYHQIVFFAELANIKLGRNKLSQQ
jgi:hypothetical protein